DVVYELVLVLAGDFEMFDSLGKLACSRRRRFEQSRVLDGDHGLVGEGCDQINLFFREWLHDVANQQHNANFISTAQEGYTKTRAVVASALQLIEGILGIGEHIQDLNRFPL